MPGHERAGNQIRLIGLGGESLFSHRVSVEPLSFVGVL